MNYHHVTQRADSDVTINQGEDFPARRNTVRRT